METPNPPGTVQFAEGVSVTLATASSVAGCSNYAYERHACIVTFHHFERSAIGELGSVASSFLVFQKTATALAAHEAVQIEGAVYSIEY